ncbi:MAG: TIGR03960 family B12-binding radical SAM protein [Candidatus Latescibacterota bacterium]|nr:MAG: TIGR03960 family B12-binding radical SAM protein [Candidatus Latescibacterota bacterium]
METPFKRKILNRVLPRVQKPGQYAGGERNQAVKDPEGVDLRVALAFPDTYAVGMSHLGLQILYHMLNQRADVFAERVFAPWIDMEAELRTRDLPLYALETFTPMCDFDVVGFSMQYELCYTNLLNMLELGGIPVTTDARTGSDPVILGGGSISAAMEPVAPFFDAILVGDAEDVLDDIIDTIIRWKHTNARRQALFESLARIPGVYVPSLYTVDYNADGSIEKFTARGGAPMQISKTTVADFENAPHPVRPVVPNVQTIHDRINVEIMRGCPNQCRFCQAVKHYRPLKYRSIDKILELCEATYGNTGYEEISLTSLSTADYPGIERLIPAIARQFNDRHVNVCLPSLRIKEELESLPDLVSTVRKSGLTMAPEVATDRLRAIIRKQISNDDLLRGCAAAWKAGYRLLKFYFMIGLPTETDEDLRAIVQLADQASLSRKRLYRKRGKINVAISSHVPKPHTPFQWERMNTREEIIAKQRIIRTANRSSFLNLKFHNVDESYLEAVFSRGDRRLAAALLRAREKGLRMDAWSECFDMLAWEEVFEDTGIDPDAYAYRERRTDEIMPWDIVTIGSPRHYLIKERKRAHEAMA